MGFHHAAGRPIPTTAGEGSEARAAEARAATAVPYQGHLARQEATRGRALAAWNPNGKCRACMSNSRARSGDLLRCSHETRLRFNSAAAAACAACSPSVVSGLPCAPTAKQPAQRGALSAAAANESGVIMVSESRRVADQALWNSSEVSAASRSALANAYCAAAFATFASAAFTSRTPHCTAVRLAPTVADGSFRSYGACVASAVGFAMSARKHASATSFLAVILSRRLALAAAIVAALSDIARIVAMQQRPPERVR
eukprot:7387669-Prymnesium_polylepis.1